MFLIIKRRYNPGCLASIFLNYPTGIYTLYVMQQQGALGWHVGLYSLLIAALSHAGMIGFVVLYSRHVMKKISAK